MGRYLLDTHAAIWFFNGDGTLSKTALGIIRDASNLLYISIVSAWELSIKTSIGKMSFKGGARGFMRLAHNNNIAILPIEAAHLSAFEILPFIHRDPFDRLLIAAAQAEHLTLISADRNIARYDVPLVW